jgi:HSP20 family protein
LDFDAESEGWMKVEEVQEDGTLVVWAELPGLDPDKDVDVSVSDGVLHISAKREERNEKKDKGS